MWGPPTVETDEPDFSVPPPPLGSTIDSMTEAGYVNSVLTGVTNNPMPPTTEATTMPIYQAASSSTPNPITTAILNQLYGRSSDHTATNPFTGGTTGQTFVPTNPFTGSSAGHFPMTTNPFIPTYGQTNPYTYTGTTGQANPIYGFQATAVEPVLLAHDTSNGFIPTTTPNTMTAATPGDQQIAAMSGASSNEETSYAEIAMIIAGSFYVLHNLNNTIRALYRHACYRSDPRLVALGHRESGGSTTIWSWASRIIETTWLPIWFDYQRLREEAVDQALEEQFAALRIRNRIVLQPEAAAAPIRPPAPAAPAVPAVVQPQPRPDSSTSGQDDDDVDVDDWIEAIRRQNQRDQ